VVPDVDLGESQCCTRSVERKQHGLRFVELAFEEACDLVRMIAGLSRLGRPQLLAHAKPRRGVEGRCRTNADDRLRVAHWRTLDVAADVAATFTTASTGRWSDAIGSSMTRTSRTVNCDAG